MRKILKHRGFEPRTFVSAHEFLNALSTLAPGCVLSDIRMPDMSGLELQKLLRSAPAFPVVLMTGYAEIRIAVEAIKNGAFEFIEKPFDMDVLCNVLRRALTTAESTLRPTTSEVLSRVALLSQREREVLIGIIRGKSSKQLARELHLSPRTVESHRARVLAKMQVRSTSELIRRVVAAGLD